MSATSFPHASAHAEAYANIALAKYWGKSDLQYNLPAVPSISVTLDPLRTETEVSFDETLQDDVLVLDGRDASPKEKKRVVAMLDQLRSMAGSSLRARVQSQNHFPTAAGLASSASGFAALAAAGAAALHLDASQETLSAMARQASASAARSIYGGFAALPAGERGQASLSASPIAGPAHWPTLRVVVAVLHEGPKQVGSTEGMERSRSTSPIYNAWVEGAPALAEEIMAGVMACDLNQVGPAMEQSTLTFHACAMTSRPSIWYWRPATLATLAALRDLREVDGVSVWCTMDAGPHVKALCEEKDLEAVRACLAKTEGVLRTIEASPGPGVQVR